MMFKRETGMPAVDGDAFLSSRRACIPLQSCSSVFHSLTHFILLLPLMIIEDAVTRIDLSCVSAEQNDLNKGLRVMNRLKGTCVCPMQS